MTRRDALAVVPALLLAGACFSEHVDEEPVPTDPSGDPTAVTVRVRNNFFVGETVTVKVGGTITWTWEGENHNVTPVLTPTFSPASPTRSAPFTHGPVDFDQPGTYRYICTIHGDVVDGQPTGMRGTIIVR